VTPLSALSPGALRRTHFLVLAEELPHRNRRRLRRGVEGGVTNTQHQNKTELHLSGCFFFSVVRLESGALVLARLRFHYGRLCCEGRRFARRFYRQRMTSSSAFFAGESESHPGRSRFRSIWSSVFGKIRLITNF
jgi:hypothetical protein